MRNVLGAVIAAVTILAGGAANEAQAQAPVTLTDGVPPAGVYRLQPMHTLTCLGYIGSGSRRHLGLMGGCRATPVDQRTQDVEHFELTVLPLPTGGAAIQPNTRSDSYCLTVARGVVVGPAALEFEWCGPSWGGTPGFSALRPGPSEWRNAHFDQRFRFEPAAGGGYTLRTANLECVDVRNGGSAAGTEAIQWACNGQDNQRFALTYLGPLAEPAQVVAATMSSEATFTLAPAALRADPGFVVETGVAMRREDMSSMPAGAAWAIAAPFRFSIEGVGTLTTTCRVFAANGAVLGESQTQFGVGGPREGVARIGVPRTGASGDAASFECLGVLRGLRGGIDWHAWEFQDSGSPTGWAQFVKEDDDTRFWTGAPFTSQVRLRIAG